MIDRVIRFCLENKLVVALLVLLVVGWGVLVAPFDWELGALPRSPVPTDAIPDIGENQQIVFTEWMGRSPQDVEDQITYPLTVALFSYVDRLGIGISTDPEAIPDHDKLKRCLAEAFEEVLGLDADRRPRRRARRGTAA